MHLTDERSLVHLYDTNEFDIISRTAASDGKAANNDAPHGDAKSNELIEYIRSRVASKIMANVPFTQSEMDILFQLWYDGKINFHNHDIKSSTPAEVFIRHPLPRKLIEILKKKLQDVDELEHTIFEKRGFISILSSNKNDVIHTNLENIWEFIKDESWLRKIMPQALFDAHESKTDSGLPPMYKALHRNKQYADELLFKIQKDIAPEYADYIRANYKNVINLDKNQQKIVVFHSELDPNSSLFNDKEFVEHMRDGEIKSGSYISTKNKMERKWSIGLLKDIDSWDHKAQQWFITRFSYDLPFDLPWFEWVPRCSDWYSLFSEELATSQKNARHVLLAIYNMLGNRVYARMPIENCKLTNLLEKYAPDLYNNLQDLVKWKSNLKVQSQSNSLVKTADEKEKNKSSLSQGLALRLVQRLKDHSFQSQNEKDILFDAFTKGIVTIDDLRKMGILRITELAVRELFIECGELPTQVKNFITNHVNRTGLLPFRYAPTVAQANVFDLHLFYEDCKVEEEWMQPLYLKHLTTLCLKKNLSSDDFAGGSLDSHVFLMFLDSPVLSKKFIETNEDFVYRAIAEEPKNYIFFAILGGLFKSMPEHPIFNNDRTREAWIKNIERYGLFTRNNNFKPLMIVKLFGTLDEWDEDLQNAMLPSMSYVISEWRRGSLIPLEKLSSEWKAYGKKIWPLHTRRQAPAWFIQHLMDYEKSREKNQLTVSHIIRGMDWEGNFSDELDAIYLKVPTNAEQDSTHKKTSAKAEENDNREQEYGLDKSLQMRFEMRLKSKVPISKSEMDVLWRALIDGRIPKPEYYTWADWGGVIGNFIANAKVLPTEINKKLLTDIENKGVLLWDYTTEDKNIKVPLWAYYKKNTEQTAWFKRAVCKTLINQNPYERVQRDYDKINRADVDLHRYCLLTSTDTNSQDEHQDYIMQEIIKSAQNGVLTSWGLVRFIYYLDKTGKNKHILSDPDIKNIILLGISKFGMQYNLGHILSDSYSDMNQWDQDLKEAMLNYMKSVNGDIEQDDRIYLEEFMSRNGGVMPRWLWDYLIVTHGKELNATKWARDMIRMYPKAEDSNMQKQSSSDKVSQSLNDALLARLNGIYANPRALGQKELDLVFDARDDQPKGFSDQEKNAWEKIIQLSDKLPSRLKKEIESYAEDFNALPKWSKHSLNFNKMYTQMLNRQDPWLKNLLIQCTTGTFVPEDHPWDAAPRDRDMTVDLAKKYLLNTSDDTDVKNIMDKIQEKLRHGEFTEFSKLFFENNKIDLNKFPHEFKQKVVERIAKEGLSDSFKVLFNRYPFNLVSNDLIIDEDIKRAIEQYVQNDARVNRETRYFIQNEISGSYSSSAYAQGRKRVMKDWLMTLLKSIADDDQTSPKQNGYIDTFPKGSWAREIINYYYNK